jgi:ATP-dependent helicase/nuclease subunit A
LPELAAGTGAVVEGSLPYLARASRAPTPVTSPTEVPFRHEPRPPARGPLGISTTPLATFDQCPRRYRWIHELSLEAPPFAREAASDVAAGAREARRALGTAAHRVLERWPLERWGEPTDPGEIARRWADDGFAGTDSEPARVVARELAAFLGGRYAARVRAEGRAVLREERFVLPLESETGVLALRGTIDLLVIWADGSADVLDYKNSWRPELASYDFQLRAYALAARRRYTARAVRIGALNLARTAEPELVELTEAELDAFERHLADLKARFAMARTSGDFAGVDRPVCERLRCGFVTACHDLGKSLKRDGA